MEKKNNANEDGAGTGSEEAAAAAADVDAEIDDGSVASMDDYMTAMGPGVSRKPDGEQPQAEVEEEEEGEDGQEGESAEGEEAEIQEEPEGEEHGKGLKALGLDDEQEAAVGKIIERRVAKPVAQRKAAEERAKRAEERAEELQRKLDSAEQPAVAAAGNVPPIMMAESESDVDRYESDLRAVLRGIRRWVDDNDRDSVYVAKPEGGKEIEFSWSEVRQKQYQLEDDLSDLVPKARKAVARRASEVEAARKKYPSLFDRESEDHTRMNSILRDAPQLRQLPNYHVLIGRMIVGERLESAPKKKALAAVPQKPTAARPPETAAPSKTKPSPRTPEINPKATTMDEYMGIKT